jgi:hypothetical protein
MILWSAYDVSFRIVEDLMLSQAAQNSGSLSEITLVGGQALNFWADRYFGTNDDFVSRDIDLLGGTLESLRCAKALDAKINIADMDSAMGSPKKQKAAVNSLDRVFHNGTIPYLNDSALRGTPAIKVSRNYGLTAQVLALVKDANQNAFALVEAGTERFDVPLSGTERDRMVVGVPATLRVVDGAKHCALVMPVEAGVAPEQSTPVPNTQPRRASRCTGFPIPQGTCVAKVSFLNNT